MAYTTLPKSLLRLSSPTNGNATWATECHDYNMTRLNNVLLKFNALLNVDISALADGDVFRYELATTSWKPWHPEKAPL